MPNIKSAIKRVKTSKTNALENTMVKSEYKTAVKNFLQSVEAGDKEKAQKYNIGVKNATRQLRDFCDKNNLKYYNWRTQI